MKLEKKQRSVETLFQLGHFDGAFLIIRATIELFPNMLYLFLMFIGTMLIMSGLVLAVIFQKALEQSKAEMTQQMAKMKKIEETKVRTARALGQN